MKSGQTRTWGGLRVLAGAALLAALAVAVGCGESGPRDKAKNYVTGKITYNNGPVPNAFVEFVFTEKDKATGSTNDQGVYTITGVPAGTAKVSVKTKSAAKPPPMPQMPKVAGGVTMGAAPIDTGKTVKIPDKYADANKSGLTATLNAGKNTYDIPLTD
jgi:hypothetical protein